MSIVIGGFLALILLLSILREIKKFEALLEKIPLLMMFIPSWSFFAPIPGMLDYNLMYRAIDKNEKIEDWKLVNELKDKRPFYIFIWNPEKKFTKGLMDIAQELMRFSNKVKDSKQICLSIPYLLILNHVNYLNHAQSFEKIQFMLLTNSYLYKPEVIFLSDVHPIRR